MEELFALGFEKCGGFFVQEEVEECVPHFPHRVGTGRSPVCDHREEKHIPCCGSSALSRSFHTRVDEWHTQDGRFDIAASEI